MERSHRIDSEEFYRLLEGQVIDDAACSTDKLQEWEDYYNYHRPHGALGGQTPYERLRQKPKTHCHRPPSVAHAQEPEPRPKPVNQLPEPDGQACAGTAHEQMRPKLRPLGNLRTGRSHDRGRTP